MPKKLSCSFLLVFVCFYSFAGQPVLKSDSIHGILRISDQATREKNLHLFISDCFQAAPLEQLPLIKIQFNNALASHKIENDQAFKYFIESAYQSRLKHLDTAQNAMISALDIVTRADDHYLIFTFLSYLAFIETEQGNAIAAVSSYRLARKEAVSLNDAMMQLVVDINISDIYYKINFYSQSLFYLDQAQQLIALYKDKDARIKTRYPHFENILLYNKAENFFRMNQPDSLNKYYQWFSRLKLKTRKIYTYKNRTHYYLYLLQHNYVDAINLINQLRIDSSFNYTNQDDQNLADAYFSGGSIDAATILINKLLADSTESNHPEIKYHLYEVLGRIAEIKKDFPLAAKEFKLALQQAKDNDSRLTQVENIASLIKADELEASYLVKSATYKTERTWLIFIIITAVLMVAVIFMFYLNIRQKRHYEKLLFTAKKEELAYINSHEVRKHLTNILGLIEVIKQSTEKNVEYANTEERLFYSAEQLDKAIKNISEKLDD